MLHAEYASLSEIARGITGTRWSGPRLFGLGSLEGRHDGLCVTVMRYATYTRKSNEEGRDQAFSSLAAQREAGLDYNKSLKHEGWIAVEATFDDGRFSGGTVKRPGLERLLDDIDKGRVDVTSVYKVDRLNGSLNYFARMKQLLGD